MSTVFICPQPLACLHRMHPSESEFSGSLLRTLSSSPRVGSEPMALPLREYRNRLQSLGVNWPQQVYGNKQMVAFLHVIRTPALTVALTEIAKCLSPAPSFCFQNGMGFSASSYYSCASMQMMNLGFLKVLTLCSPIPD